jgi:uncharacterized protein (DUF2384 family)
MTSLAIKDQADRSSREAETLTTAVVNAAKRLQMNQATIADVLGVSEPTASRLFAGTYKLQRTRKREWEFALLFVRFFRSLDAILGHGEQSRKWLNGANTGLGARPIDLVRTAEGIVRVLNYLDAYRGRV